MTHKVDVLVTHHTLDLGDIRLHAVEAGQGPLVVLLHGFPEFWYSWRNQIPALRAAGYRAVALDLRGYGESDKPEDLNAYRSEILASDVANVIAAYGCERATVVGHDWGGMVAWFTALARPEVVERLVIANAPHPARYNRALRSPAQLARSSYIGLFQLPALPELLLGGRRSALLRRLLRSAATRPGAFTEDDLQRYADSFAQPGALTGALAYYRWMGRRVAAEMGAGAARRLLGGRRRDRSLPAPPSQAEPESSSRGLVRAPTLIIWSANDPVLPLNLADPGPDLVPDRRLEVIDAGHFLQADAPEEFNHLLLDFLSAHS
ncbi:MAG: alpha/beta fold hydrolase [Nitriliruptorales bacterium]|nr:alpha/beta fold hydrolase [Nitriliruptorales bacterium]